MTRAEIFEEIRTLLKDVQAPTVTTPYTYKDSELVLQVRSALRWARTQGVDTDAELSAQGALSPEPTERVGVLLSYRVASQLLSGDLISRLSGGELGFYFRAGDNIIDTKTAANTFKTAAAAYQAELKELLTLVLSDNSTGNVYGDPGLSV